MTLSTVNRLHEELEMALVDGTPEDINVMRDPVGAKTGAPCVLLGATPTSIGRNRQLLQEFCLYGELHCGIN